MSDQVAVGLMAPDFEFVDVEKQTRRLADYRRQKHVILIFTRGFL